MFVVPVFVYMLMIFVMLCSLQNNIIGLVPIIYTI